MAHDLGRALLAADAVSAEALGIALFTSVKSGVSLVRALLATNAIDYARLDAELARLAPDAPLLKHPVPLAELLDRLPPRLCESLVALPVRRDPRTGTVDVALADVHDEHAASEVAFFLGAEVRPVRSPVASLEVALARMRSVLKMRAAATGSEPPPRSRGPFLDLAEEARASVPATLSERPTPYLARSPSEPAPGPGDTPGGEVAIPLSRRFVPSEDDGLVMSLTRVAEDPVVELRSGRPPSDPPHTVPTTTITATTGAAVFPAESTTHPYGAAPLQQLLKEMHKLTARDPLGELVLLAARQVAMKTALFAVKKDAFTGWMCTSDFGDRLQFADVRIGLRAPSFLSAAASAGTYVGPLLRNESHAPLVRFFKSPRPDLIALAIRAANRPAVILVAHDVGNVPKVIPALAEIARAAGEALERIVVLARGGAPSKR